MLNLRPQRIWPLLLAAYLSTVPPLAASESEVILAREEALSAAIDKRDLQTVESLVTSDVRVVRSEGIAFTTRPVVRRLAALFDLSPGWKFSRSVDTLRISKSSDFAFVTGTQHLRSDDGLTISSRYLSIWRKKLEFEQNWCLSFDAPLEVWKSLDDLVSVEEVAHTPGLLVVRLRTSELAEQDEGSAPFRQSEAEDLAYSVGSYYAPPSPDSPKDPPLWGSFLTTWEKDGSDWKLVHASFPEPKGTRPP